MPASLDQAHQFTKLEAEIDKHIHHTKLVA
jgi:hypothetical protein